MARLQDADGGDGLQFWKVAVNTSNKQPSTAEKGLSCSFGVDRVANNPSP
jgi:hypothetical protein